MFSLSKFLKAFLFALFLATLTAGCGDTVQDDSSDISALDLTVDTVAINVPLPIQMEPDLSMDKGKASLHATSPVPFDQIKTIRIIAKDASGNNRLIGIPTVQDTGDGTQGIRINDLQAIHLNDRIWISDAKNPQQYICYVQFLENTRIFINVDLNLYIGKNEVGGSDSVAEIYTPGQTQITFYVNFVRK